MALRLSFSLRSLLVFASILSLVPLFCIWYVLPSELSKTIKAYSVDPQFEGDIGSLVLGDENRMRIAIFGRGVYFKRIKLVPKYLGGFDVYVDRRRVLPSSDLVLILLQDHGFKCSDVDFSSIRHLLIDNYSIRLPNDYLIRFAFGSELHEN